MTLWWAFRSNSTQGPQQILSRPWKQHTAQPKNKLRIKLEIDNSNTFYAPFPDCFDLPHFWHLLWCLTVWKLGACSASCCCGAQHSLQTVKSHHHQERSRIQRSPHFHQLTCGRVFFPPFFSITSDTSKWLWIPEDESRREGGESSVKIQGEQVCSGIKNNKKSPCHARLVLYISILLGKYI